MAVTTPRPRLLPDRAPSTNGSAAVAELTDPRYSGYDGIVPRDSGLTLGTPILACQAAVYGASWRQR